MIFVTGDVHGYHDFEKLRHPRLQSLTSDDYIIICGDAGLIWIPDEQQYPDAWENQREEIEQYVREEEDALERLSKQPWTTLFVDGNHENFPRLYQFPVKDFCGGKAAQINDKVWHLRRGEVFEICGKKIFAMGGATSVDKEQRLPGVSWWPEEIPTAEEWANAHANLNEHRWKVDYVFTHSVPESVRTKIKIPWHRRHNLAKLTDDITLHLDEIYKKLEYKNWYAGHWHQDELMHKERVHLLYNTIVFAGGPTTQKGNTTYQMIESAKRGWLDLAEIYFRRSGDVAKIPGDIRGKVCTYCLLNIGGGEWEILPEIRRLIKYGADVNARDENGYTPAMMAASRKHTGVVRLLISSGADLSIESDGETVLSLLEQGRQEWQELQKQEGAMELHSDDYLKRIEAAIALVKKRIA